jgi:hypothetical protein
MTRVERVILTTQTWGFPTVGVDELTPVQAFIGADGTVVYVQHPTPLQTKIDALATDPIVSSTTQRTPTAPLTATPTGPADQLPLSAESGSVVESAPVATERKP